MPYRFVFQVRLRPGEEKPFVEAWQNSSLAIQHMPGARGTRLHRKLGEERVYVAIAEWESKEARDQAFEKLRNPDNLYGNEMRRWPRDQDFGEWTLIGELEEVASAFPPINKRGE